MGKFWSIGAAALSALCAAACATLAPVETGAPAQSYRQAADALIAATQTKGDYLSTSMSERAPCEFGFYLSPGRQSTIGFLFDARQLDLKALSPAQGQAAQSPVSRRIGCAKKYGLCASNTGMPVNFIEIGAPTADDMDSALAALRAVQAACPKKPATP